MRILIIGGTRFIGPHVVRRLVNEGHNLAVFHRGETEVGSTDLDPLAKYSLSTVEHIHGERQNLPQFANQFKNFSPELVLDMTAYTEPEALDLIAVFRDLARRVVTLSSMDVYR